MYSIFIRFSPRGYFFLQYIKIFVLALSIDVVEQIAQATALAIRKYDYCKA